MSWSKKMEKSEPEPGFDDFFTPLEKIDMETYLKVLVFGAPETGKTHFGLSGPEPVVVIDTEYGAGKVAKVNFPTKRIFIADVVHIDKKTAEVDAIKSLEKVEKIVGYLVKNSEEFRGGTLVIDSVSDIWSWIITWLEAVANAKTRDGRPMRFEYGTANERYRKIMLRLLALPMHVVMTARETSEYDSSGRELPTKTGKWQKETPYWADVVIHMTKFYDPGIKRMRYKYTIKKCRFKRAFEKSGEDLNWEKLIADLEELGVSFRSNGG